MLNVAKLNANVKFGIIKDMFSDKYRNTHGEDDNNDKNEGGSVFVENKDDGYIKCACSTANYNFVNCNCKHLGLI